jgi:hypothetical protein
MAPELVSFGAFRRSGKSFERARDGGAGPTRQCLHYSPPISTAQITHHSSACGRVRAQSSHPSLRSSEYGPPPRNPMASMIKPQNSGYSHPPPGRDPPALRPMRDKSDDQKLDADRGSEDRFRAGRGYEQDATAVALLHRHQEPISNRTTRDGFDVARLDHDRITASCIPPAPCFRRDVLSNPTCTARGV